MYVLLLVLLVSSINLTLSGSNGHRVKRIVGGRHAAQPPEDDPVVFAHMYNRDARVEGFRNLKTGVYSFLGLRYADPPTGLNRFARPRYRRLEGDINATLYGLPCPQPDPYNPNRVVGNEDCLVLNIFSPKMPDETTGLPVYIWIHPGGFRYGSAAQYGAEPIAQEGVIFVPIQYRLGTLGTIGDGTKEFNGNLAMFDMTAALRWVTEYISFFGGDPKQIKVIGHGSGAASAMYMSMSRLPRSGSINGVVSMSGSALSQYARDKEPVQSLGEISEINGCLPNSNETEIIKCLRAKTAQEIVIKDTDIQTERLQGRALIKGIAGGVGFSPHLEEPDDGRSLPGFLTSEPEEALQEGEVPEIPLLIGVTKDETGNGLTLKNVENIWGTAQKFLNSLLDLTDNLNNLLNIDEVTGKILKPALPGLGGLGLEDLLKVSASLNPIEILQKLTEATTDMLFNLPAVLSAKNWANKAPAILYSFEYKGNLSNGFNFLKGLPIVSENKNPNYTAHGDDLGYLFDANDIFGKPIEEAKLKDPDDFKVRNNLITLLTKFASYSTSKAESDGIFPTFGDKKGTPFIKLTDKLEVLENFRFCELSLWGAPLQAVQSTTCEGLAKTLNSLTGTVGTVAGGLGDVTGGLTGTLGLNSKPKNNNKGSGGLLGGLG